MKGGERAIAALTLEYRNPGLRAGGAWGGKLVNNRTTRDGLARR